MNRLCHRLLSALLVLGVFAPDGVTGPDCGEFLGAMKCPVGDNTWVGYQPWSDEIDPELRAALAQYFEARVSGDVDALISLTLSLSFDHQALEAARHRSAIESMPLLGYLHCAFAADDTNPFHIRVGSKVVTATITGGCQEAVFGTEWVLLDGEWYVFPEGAPSYSGAKKSRRPNSLKQFPFGDELLPEKPPDQVLQLKSSQLKKSDPDR